MAIIGLGCGVVKCCLPSLSRVGVLFYSCHFAKTFGFFQQFCIGATVNHPALTELKYAIALFYSSQTVGNQDDGQFLAEAVDGGH